MFVVVLLHFAVARLSDFVGDHSSGGTHQSDATALLAEGELTVYIVDLVGTREEGRELLLQTLRLDLLLELLELALSLQELSTLFGRGSLDLLIGETLDQIVDLLFVRRPCEASGEGAIPFPTRRA